MHQIKYEKPKVVIHNNGNIELLKDWTVHYGDQFFTVPKGFISDGNSVPRPFQGLVPKFGPNTIAGIAHDWLYYARFVDTPTGQFPQAEITRRQADVIRLDLCRWCCVPATQRFLSYIGLRIGGWATWNGYRKTQ